ncbi:MAG TPA: DUF882 domain-containing protein [Labilithrix sp.]|nr:DUF882 domain-containing protein [Labilithrix sp.]
MSKHHHKKADKAAEKADKAEKGDAVVRVHHSGKTILKPVLHHASNVDVGGAGHKEPKVEKNVSVVPASLTTKPAHGKTAHASHKAEAKPAEMPKLPNPNATKASKAGNEKGAKKGAEKKTDDGGDKDGQPGRDGDFADLVAHIRGKHDPKSSSEPQAEPKADPKADGPAEPSDGKRPAHHSEARLRRTSARTPVCAKDPIEMIRGPEIDKFELTKCDGSVAPLAVEHLSVLIRPGSAARPVAPLIELAKKKGAELAHGVHRVDERLAVRIQSLADHFAKPGSPLKLSIVSGVRPTSIGSMHATGRAIDFRIEGTKNEDVVAFCKTLTDTGCGFYPNSSFVHLDVRDPGAGHVSWIDASGPGESPRYVTAWPPKSKAGEGGEGLEPATAKQPVEDQDGMPEAVDAHPGESPQ